MRRLLRFTVTLIAVALAGLGGAAWYFSSMIRDGALAIDPGEPARNLEVTDVTGNRITLTEREVDPYGNVEDPGTWGLDYDGGYALLTGEPEVDGADTVRTFTVVEGEPPAVGDRAGTDLYSFPEEPMAPWHEVAYPSGDTEIPAWFAPGTSDTWVIGIHGRGGPKEEMLRLMVTTSDLGHPGLTIGYRNDVDAEPDPSGRYTFGATEWEDLAAAVEWAEDQGAKDVILAGSSMGGAITASYLRHRPDAPVRAVILDSPALDLRATVEYAATQVDLPVTPPRFLSSWAMWLTSQRFGVDWDDTDYLSDTSWVRVPTLVFHGDVDDTVPIATSRALAARSDLVELVELGGVDHVRAWNADPEAFDARVRTFLKSL